MVKQTQLALSDPAEWLGDWHPLAEQLGSTDGLVALGSVSSLLRLRPVRQLAPGHWLMAPESNEDFVDLLGRLGETPLPCYIRRGHAQDPDREARAGKGMAGPTPSPIRL